jgi:hypothetical protein
MLVSTPERWFRTRLSDFYQIHLTEGQKDLPAELIAWIGENLQDPKIEILGPSERSGWITGGPRIATLAMSDTEVLKFSQCWEDATGKSLDPRWQCYQGRYADWLEQFDRIAVYKGAPPKGTQYRWLLCDAGLYWFQGHYQDADTRYPDLPGEPCIDDWWWACKKFPEIKAATVAPFMMGYDCLDGKCERNVTFQTYQQRGVDATYGPHLYVLKDLNLVTARVREALGYSGEFDINYGFF